MQLAQIAKIVSCVAAVDTGGVAKLGAHINMAKYNHVTFIISVGAIGNNATVTVLGASDSAGTGGVAMAYNYYLSTGGAAVKAVLESALVSVAATGYTLLAASDDNEIMVIEVDADEIVTNSKPYIGVNVANAAACLVSVVAVCMQPRYAANPASMPDPTTA